LASTPRSSARPAPASSLGCAAALGFAARKLDADEPSEIPLAHIDSLSKRFDIGPRHFAESNPCDLFAAQVAACHGHGIFKLCELWVLHFQVHHFTHWPGKLVAR
jgi:hypothetical protein